MKRLLGNSDRKEAGIVGEGEKVRVHRQSFKEIATNLDNLFGHNTQNRKIAALILRSNLTQLEIQMALMQRFHTASTSIGKRLSEIRRIVNACGTFAFNQEKSPELGLMRYWITVEDIEEQI
jgi:hypothetical protein